MKDSLHSRVQLCDDRESAFCPALRSVPARVKERGHDSALGDSPFCACVKERGRDSHRSAGMILNRFARALLG